jgi:hypothetical protein
MATIFLSYRRTDSPQACRVYDWLTQRFGKNAVFMDPGIPFAVNYADYIQHVIEGSSMVIALIGPEWLKKIHQPEDPVRTEIESAMQRKLPIVPILIGNTAMPTDQELPASIASLAMQNAVVVGISQDFHAHMQLLLPRIEAILGAIAAESIVLGDPRVILSACQAVMLFLREQQTKHLDSIPDLGDWSYVEWNIIAPSDFNNSTNFGVTLLLHRVSRLAELLDLHFILTFWRGTAEFGQVLAGWVMQQLERHPAIPDEILSLALGRLPEWRVKVRVSDEDPRQIWKTVTDDPLRLSLAYVATVSPREMRQPAIHATAPVM